jgi:DNA-binding NarL/FixJ family response regulator
MGMSLWNRILHSLGYRRVVPGPIRCDPELQAHIRALAREEHLPEGEVTNALLAAGLARHQEELELERRWAMLTQRERQVAALVCREYLFREIAAELKVSIHTVKSHVRNISRKLEVEGKEAVRNKLLGATGKFIARRKGRRRRRGL